MQLDPPLQQLFSKQRHIHQLKQELKSLHNTNEQLKANLDKVTQERDHLVGIQQQDPIRMILQGFDGMAEKVSLNFSNETLEQRIHFHQEKILSLEQEVRELRDYLNQKDSQFLEINKMLQSLRQKQTYLLNENNRLLLENQSLKEQKDQLIRTIEKYNSKWQKLATQINQAKTQFFQTTSKNSQELLNCQQDIDKLRNSWLRAANFLTDQEEWKKREEPDKIQQLTEKIKLQSQIMEELGRELDMRNDEIAQIQKNKNKNKNSQMNPYDTYEHSLNNMIHSAKQRERQYTEILKKYQSIAENYKQSIKQKQILQNQYAKLKQSYENISAIQKENNKLRRQLERIRQGSAASQQLNKQLLDDLDVCLKENQQYFNLMQDIYGSEVMAQRMKVESQKYEQRRKERASKELWANTTELIEMNQKLKQKIRKQ